MTTVYCINSESVEYDSAAVIKEVESRVPLPWLSSIWRRTCLTASRVCASFLRYVGLRRELLDTAFDFRWSIGYRGQR